MKQHGDRFAADPFHGITVDKAPMIGGNDRAANAARLEVTATEQTVSLIHRTA
jgi:hypothetical protein